LFSPLASGLPDFPWDRIAAAGDHARNHPDGIIDLSIGTPVDDTPEVITRALANAANAPGYPTAAGLVEFRQAWVDWSAKTLNAHLTLDQVSPAIGSKEIVAWLPIVLGLNAQSVVAIPQLAYPTYAVGALMAHASVVTYTSAQTIPDNVDLIWVNSPSNPTGEVLSVPELKSIVARGRELGAPVVSDECYIELGWDVEPVSILDPRVCGTDQSGILAVHSLSKRSNLAGYRSGAVLGDTKLIADIISLRKHSGMLMPTPIQIATIAALGDEAHVAIQREKYAKRRDLLHTAFSQAGFRIDHSNAGLYLWVSDGRNCLETVSWLSDRGVLAAPGDFYGPAGTSHVRIALTATDERVAACVSRLQAAIS
jgi:succinyldiaminopimelate transaminase